MVAIDTTDRQSALDLARITCPAVGAFKIGLGLLHGPGPCLIEDLTAIGRPVFADAKLHDIPTQVERAAMALGRAGARWVTVHASGGAAMMEAAVAGLEAGSDGAGGILSVSVLTSLDGASLRQVGISGEPDELVAAMASAAAAAGAEGMVCSPHEIEVVKTAAPGLTIVTPGIRPAGTPAGDQRRTATPAAAIAAGAAWLVIGRPITAAADPAAAAADIAQQINA
jgi:orotidine-5'-phosphate decarboxylase